MKKPSDGNVNLRVCKGGHNCVFAKACGNNFKGMLQL